jgi:hypothetical protein
MYGFSYRGDHRLIDVFLSYAREDADWAAKLADRLVGHGAKVFFDEWSLLPGDVVVHKIDAAVRESRSGIVVISPASVASPRALAEYAALARASATRGLRFIPVLIGDVLLAPSAENRVWRDFRDVTGRRFDEKAAELAAAVLGREPALDGPVPWENLQAALPSRPRPITEPDRHRIVICYAAADAGYGQRLAAQLTEAGLPVWSLRDLRPGDEQFWLIRQQLRHAIAVIVLMSPESNDSDDILRMILESRAHGRTFFPILLHGERNYHLAATWYVDARDGRLLGPDELAMLARLHKADQSGRPLEPDKVLPAPLERPLVRAVRIPSATSLDRLDAYLREGELQHADLLTTDLLLEETRRSAQGWIREQDGPRLSAELLAGIDAVWSERSHGRQGFRVQSTLVRVRDGSYSEFLNLAVECGWCDPEDGHVVTDYHAFAEQAGGRGGFFPTLRNPQNQRYVDWYDQWTETVLAVHLRFDMWEATP